MTNCSNMSNTEFIKFITSTELKEEDFKKMFDDLNNKYFDISREVIETNERRSEVLDKIRKLQVEYKNLLGHIEIEEDEESIEEDVKAKNVKKNRKKSEINNSDDDNIDDTDNLLIKLKDENKKSSIKEVIEVKELEKKTKSKKKIVKDELVEVTEVKEVTEVTEVAEVVEVAEVKEIKEELKEELKEEKKTTKSKSKKTNDDKKVDTIENIPTEIKSKSKGKKK